MDDSLNEWRKEGRKEGMKACMLETFSSQGKMVTGGIIIALPTKEESGS